MVKIYPCLPPSLDENDGRASYDFKSHGAVVNIVLRALRTPHNTQRFVWKVGICCVKFGIASLIPLSSAQQTLPHWEFISLMFTSSKQGNYHPARRWFQDSYDDKKPKTFVLGINFREGRKGLMLEAVWHTPDQDPKYHRFVNDSEITPVRKCDELRRIYSFREIVLHGKSIVLIFNEWNMLYLTKSFY